MKRRAFELTCGILSSWAASALVGLKRRLPHPSRRSPTAPTSPAVRPSSVGTRNRTRAVLVAPAPAPTPPTVLTRRLAIVHLAMHDAANAVRDHYETYALAPLEDSGANPALAAAVAARDALVAFVPASKATLDAMLAGDLASEDHAKARERSVAIGGTAAQTILALRANDGLDRRRDCDLHARHRPRQIPADRPAGPPPALAVCDPVRHRLAGRLPSRAAVRARQRRVRGRLQRNQDVRPQEQHGPDRRPDPRGEVLDREPADQLQPGGPAPRHGAGARPVGHGADVRGRPGGLCRRHHLGVEHQDPALTSGARSPQSISPTPTATTRPTSTRSGSRSNTTPPFPEYSAAHAVVAAAAAVVLDNAFGHAGFTMTTSTAVLAARPGRSPTSRARRSTAPTRASTAASTSVTRRTVAW